MGCLLNELNILVDGATPALLIRIVIQPYAMMLRDPYLIFLKFGIILTVFFLFF